MAKIKSFEDKITSLIFLIGRNMRQRNAKNCSLGHLSFIQIEALKFISEQKNPLMKDVASHLFIAAPSLTPIIDELEKKNLIKRSSSKNDRRAVLIFLTKIGEDVINKISRIKTENMRHIFNKLTEKEQKILINILEKISGSKQ